MLRLYHKVAVLKESHGGSACKPYTDQNKYVEDNLITQNQYLVSIQGRQSAHHPHAFSSEMLSI